MSQTFQLPALGENIAKAQVIGVLVSPGDHVEKDQSVIEVETDKASLEVPSPASGRVAELFVSEGDTIEVGKDFIRIETEGAASSGAKREQPAKAEPKRAEGKKAPAPKAQPTPEPAPDDEALEAEEVAEAAAADGAARDGNARAAAEPTRAPAPRPSAPQRAEAERRGAFAAPSVRRFAREIGVEIETVTGSGPGGRISIADVKEHARTASHAPAAPPARELEPGHGLEFQPREDAHERRPLSNVRRTIAERMTQSWTTIPHVTLHARADVTEIEEVRQRYKAHGGKAGAKLTITAVLLKVVGSALKVFPQVNSSLEPKAGELLVKRSVHVGVAVDTERGLLVPVVRHVDHKNILELSSELAAISEKARTGKLKPDEMKGAGFTLTNLGGLGIAEFTPIINPPEAAVLGVGRAEEVPSLVEGELVARQKLPLSLSFDHRILDGADGARFLQWVVRALEDPLVLALEG